MSDADLFTDQPAPAGGDLFTDEPAPKSFLQKTASNVIPDIKSVGAGLKDIAQGPALDIASGDIASALPKLAKTGEEFMKNPVENLEAAARPVTHPVDYFQEHPVQQTLNVLGAAEGLKGMMSPKMEVAGAVKEGLPVIEPGAKTGAPHALFAYNDEFGPGGQPRSVYNVFGDPEHPAIKQIGHGSSVSKDMLDKAGIPITGREPKSVGKYEPLEPTPARRSTDAEKAAGIIPIERAMGETVNRGPSSAAGKSAGFTPNLAPEASPAPAAPGGPPTSTLDTLAGKGLDKANEVKNYISKGYEGYAKKPGTAAEVADYVQEKSQMMAAQQMGATPLQARQIGHEGVRALGQYALDNDIVGPTTGLKGMRAKTNALNEAAGKTIGDIRTQADSLRVPTENTTDVLQQIRQKFDPVFSRGSRSGEAGAYAKALEELEDAKPTFQGMADLSTKLNKAANEANRLNQPHGAYTDMANEISHINNERIKTLVGPEKAVQYEKALRDFGATKKIGEFLKRKEAGEVKRMGPGSLVSNLTQKAMDEFGYRAGAKVANKLSTAIKSSPGITKSIPSMFKEFINQVEDVSHEVSGMSKGGIVPDDVKRYVSSQC